MKEPLSVLNECTQVTRLFALAAERVKADERTAAEFKEEAAKNEQLYAASQAQLNKVFEQDRDNTQREFDGALQAADAIYASEKASADRAYQEICQRFLGHCNALDAKAKKKYEETRWEANTVFEAQRHQPGEYLDRITAQLNAGADRLTALQEDAQKFIRSYKQSSLLQEAEPAVDPRVEADPFQQLQDRQELAAGLCERLKHLSIPNLFRGSGILGIWVTMFAVMLGLARWQLTDDWKHAVLTAVIGTLVAGTALTAWLYILARKHLQSVYTQFAMAVAEAGVLRIRCRDEAQRLCEMQRQRIIDRRDNELASAESMFKERTAETAERRQIESAQANDNYQRLLAEIAARKEQSLANANDLYPPRLAVINGRFERGITQAKRRYEQGKDDCWNKYDEEWRRFAETWRRGLGEVREAVAAIQARDAELFPEWTDPRLQEQLPATSMPPAIRFGSYKVRMADIPGGLVADERLRDDGPNEFALPALMDFPDRASLLLRAFDEGRTIGIKTLQAVMLRLLTSLPPGKARFTIIDPVGLGENFAAFMHLADYDDALVTNRIWTEPQHIEQRLADLTEQMENIIQKYLRNDFKTIDEYNAFAGEVAEPLRFLIVANFPANFTEAAARRLTSIAASGARCGVYTLILNDAKLPLPSHFDIMDLQRAANTLVWHKNTFVWDHETLKRFPLTLDPPPPENVVTEVVRKMGDLAKDSRRVEVPFEFIAPSPEEWWQGDTGKGIRSALGRAGATKLQYMQLGRGTSQHVLVAGKTGSGKSTLLHALVTNLALLYSPDQIELYLIDFKKGVEFKTYATHELPHARVIAIESEREFGLSVLQKLDAELKKRGDQFRAAGVQDIAGFRQAEPDTVLPRLLLVVDEFHELFVDDDKIAQDAALLLDRLVRQGRAFGIHILLGSQTLGGAYSLARSTIGQMAVRIALQCSETDAHLILSEDNSAARLLSRPGEAIYNDANGLIEGNNPFQVVWLPDERREVYLQKIHELAQAKNYTPRGRRIVFEGNIPADLAKNELLEGLLNRADWPEGGAESLGWLGEAIAIKDPTAAVFRPQNGSNLIIVGQREEPALGVMASALLGLAAQHSPKATVVNGVEKAPVKFYLFESGTPGIRESNSLARLSGALPHDVHVAGRREVPAAMAEIAAEVERRQKLEDGSQSPIFLFIDDLARFRDLRRAENEYSFSASDEPPSPAKLFSYVLREGPVLGVHTIIWCDTLNNLNRTFDRQTMREFDMRVLFQMSQSDSSNLIDTPAASKLGPNLALYYNEEEGRAEKFRPYSQPTDAYLAQLQQRIRTARGLPRSDSIAQ